MKPVIQIRKGDTVQGKSGDTKIIVTKIEEHGNLILFYGKDGHYLPTDKNSNVVCNENVTAGLDEILKER